MADWTARDRDAFTAHWARTSADPAVLRRTILADFLAEESRRPLWARVAHGNAGSLRVLEKCGFKVVGDDQYSNKAGEVAGEFVLTIG